MRNCGMPNMSKSEKEQPAPQALPLPPALSPSDGAREGAAAETKQSFWRRRPVVVVGTVALFGLLFYGVGYLAESLTHEATDDAFLDSSILSIAPKVPGQVKSVPVKSNQAVKAGDLLVEIG